MLRELGPLAYRLPPELQSVAKAILEALSEASGEGLDLPLRLELAEAVTQLGLTSARGVLPIMIPVSVLLDHALNDPDEAMRDLSVSALLTQHFDNADVRVALIRVACAERNQPFRRRIERAFEEQFPPWKRWLAGMDDEAKIPDVFEVAPLPFRVVRFCLRNIKAFEDTTTIELFRGNSLFVGENSVGKSTILHSIALAALGPDLANQIERRPLRYLREGAEHGAIEVVFELEIDSNSREEFAIGLAIHSGETGFRPWIRAV